MDRDMSELVERLCRASREGRIAEEAETVLGIVRDEARAELAAAQAEVQRLLIWDGQAERDALRDALREALEIVAEDDVRCVMDHDDWVSLVTRINALLEVGE